MAGSNIACHVVDKTFLQDGNLFVPAGVRYIDFFKFIDKQLSPQSYFEVGTERGMSVRAFRCDAVCVDPQFKIEGDPLERRGQLHFYQMPSDVFFSRYDLRSIFPRGPDICFLDGMHRFEYLLRDIANAERACHKNSIIFLHDCIPAMPRMTLRTHKIGEASEGQFQHAWTGDVWRIIPALRKFRPDLNVLFIDCAPTGLVAISNLNPNSDILSANYYAIVKDVQSLNIEDFTSPHLLDLAPIVSSRSLMGQPEDTTLYFNIW